MRFSTEAAITKLRPTTDNDTLGGRIWRARDALNLSAKDLANQLGVKVDTIAAWERDRSEPRTNRLFMLAGILGVPPVWLIAGIGDAPKDDLAEPATMRLRDQLAAVRKAHDETGKAISALELALTRVLQDIES
ncbi:helix-turn-helix domain-containing protein [Pararhizobium antarcticum]|uniref:Transcriptional regulator n=1 Tax=Pararhizobium antarcticum TaxID=1798805 RepID=A0A657LUV9_9HYPH|nr:helix-turn-helix domain-containing protein [Pararhizobium antarcticum]OJF95473.1 transcriptional regulator [Rhizobium sp. 58]OJF97944.1 transcriptional regulator [Pararhizobium antarcticum]